MAENSLQDILSNPDTLRSMLSLVQGLLHDGEEAQSSASPTAQATSPLTGIDPRLIRMALGVLDGWGDTDERKQALLTALIPYLSPQRAAQVDRAVQLSRIAKAVRSLIDAGKEVQP